MRVAVSGWRFYKDWRRVWAELDAIHAQTPITCIIESGGQQGPACNAAQWALQNDIPVETYPSSNWGKDGEAGQRRNRELIYRANPELVVVFPGGKIMDDLIWRARKARIKVVQPVKEMADAV